MIVECDACKERFDLEKKRTKEDVVDFKKVTYEYFRCPHCGKRYLVRVVTNELMESQKKIQEVYNKMKKANTDSVYNNLLKRYERLKGGYKKIADENRKKYLIHFNNIMED